MCKHEEIYLANVLANALEPELRRGVDLHMQAIHYDVIGRARASIPKVGRRAHRAVARNHRHALGCTGAEKNDLHSRSV